MSTPTQGASIPPSVDQAKRNDRKVNERRSHSACTWTGTLLYAPTVDRHCAQSRLL